MEPRVNGGSKRWSQSSSSDGKPEPTIAFMGASGVGKTSLIRRFLFNEFYPKHMPTLDHTINSQLDLYGDTVSVNILDTSGSADFPAMTELAIKSADMFVLVYSVTDRESFNRLIQLRDRIINERGKEIPMLVVGNKMDLEDERQMPFECTECTVCIEWQCGFKETSAKDSSYVVGLFKQILKCIGHNDLEQTPVLKQRRSSTGYPMGNYAQAPRKASLHNLVGLKINPFIREKKQPLDKSVHVKEKLSGKRRGSLLKVLSLMRVIGDHLGRSKNHD